MRATPRGHLTHERRQRPTSPARRAASPAPPRAADGSVATQYIYSLYFATITLATVGYGDLHAYRWAGGEGRVQ